MVAVETAECALAGNRAPGKERGHSPRDLQVVRNIDERGVDTRSGSDRIVAIGS